MGHDNEQGNEIKKDEKIAYGDDVVSIWFSLSVSVAMELELSTTRTTKTHNWSGRLTKASS